MSKPMPKKRKTESNETSKTNLIDPDMPGADYFLNLPDPKELSAPKYIAHRIATSPTTDYLTIAVEWEDWIQSLKTCESASWNVAASQAPTNINDRLLKWLTE
ncbi:hypothetical protein BGX26_005924, partial [Mortierella sp. AD094]